MLFSTLLSKASLAESLACNAGECLSWIIVLFNILTVFYLAFCAWFKITKPVKLFGWIWSAINVCSTIVVLFFHTCIFTILSAVFTGLVSMATLSVVFNKTGAADTNESNEIKILGYYVIFSTIDKKYIFRLYDKNKKHFMSSRLKYNTIEEVKTEIENCRQNGLNAMIEDRTKNWIKAVDIPKFVMIASDKKFFIEYLIEKGNVMLVSENYIESDICSKYAQKFKTAILSEELYYSKEILDGNGFVLNSNQISSKTATVQQNVNGNQVVSEPKTVVDEKIAVDEPKEAVKEAENTSQKFKTESLSKPQVKIIEVNTNVEEIDSKKNPEPQKKEVEDSKKYIEINRNVVVPKAEAKSENPFSFVYTGNIKKEEK